MRETVIIAESLRRGMLTNLSAQQIKERCDK